MTGIKNQKTYFEKLIDVIDTPIYTTRNWRQGNQYQPGKQHEVGKISPPIDHRSIGSNEVVLELDAPSYAQNYKYAVLITTYLIDNKIPYYAFWSGNKSIHIHIFLKIDIVSDAIKELVGEAIELHCNIYQEIRMKLATEIVVQCGMSKELIGHGKIVDLAKLKWNDMTGKATLIRCCGGANIKVDGITGNLNTNWKTYYEELPKNKPRLTNKSVIPSSFDTVNYPDKLDMYVIEESYVAEAAQEYIDRIPLNTKSNLNPVDFKGKFLNLPCVQSLLEGGVKVGKRNAGAKICAIAARLDKADSTQILSRYVQSVPQLPQPYEFDEALRWGKWIETQPKCYWNCKFANEIGVCNRVGCSYHEEKYKAELSLFDHNNPLELVKTALDKMIVGETMLKMQLFLLYLTKNFNPEWCILLDGPAASGKSHVMKKVADLFGLENEAYYSYSRLTQSSLNHMEELADKWSGNIVIIEELQGAKNVVEQLRVAISEGKLTLLETVEDKDEFGNKVHTAVAKDIYFKDVLFVTCNAEEYDEGEQLKSRAWILNTDQTTEQTKGIVDFYFDNFEHNKVNMPDLEIIRRAITLLEKPDKVVFPFASELKGFISTATVRARRDVKKLISLISASAYFHQKQRAWININNQRILLADWRDVLLVFGFAGETLNASTQGVGSRDLQFYDTIITNMHYTPEFTVDDVCRWCNISLAGAKKVMANLAEAGFFENTTVTPRAKAYYVKTEISPEYKGDMKSFCVEKIAKQDEKMREWIRKRTGSTGSHWFSTSSTPISDGDLWTTK